MRTQTNQTGVAVRAMLSVAAMLVVGGCASAPIQTASRPAGEAATTRPANRIGVYETRAIAVAYVGSRFNTRVDEMKAEYKEAEAAGDKKRMTELKKEANKRQARLHRQGFGCERVDEMLVPIQDKIPGICAAAGVKRMVPIWSVEAWLTPKADLTDELVAQYEPSERTLKTIRELRKHPPMIGIWFDCD